VLSEREQEIWEEIVGYHGTEHREMLPAVVVGGCWGAVLLLLFGVPSAALAVGAATALIWLVWRFVPQQSRTEVGDEQVAEPDRPVE
jgi:hypothetical protein